MLGKIQVYVAQFHESKDETSDVEKALASESSTIQLKEKEALHVEKKSEVSKFINLSIYELSKKDIEPSNHKYIMFMEVLGKTTPTKIVPKTRVVEMSIPMEIEEVLSCCPWLG